MLEPILKGLIEWLYGLMVDIMSYASGELLGVMNMDLSYFKTTAPIVTDIIDVFTAFGWALLIGNLIFQAIKTMLSGAGFEAEEPKMLFMRTFVFSFLLLASQQICEIGLSISGKVIDLLELPNSINIQIPDESMFSLGGDAKWLLAVIVGIVLMVQMVKLLFEIGERYVITSVLTFFSPLAFSMGGSKSTSDIFKGWVRMYCSMLIMMIMNIVFLKLIMSAMSQLASGGVLIWLVFVVALTRVARKIDSHIGKIGLTPAQTGNPIGGRLPGMMTMMAVKVLSSTISKSLAGGKGGKGGAGNSGGRRNSDGRRRLTPYTPSNSSGSSGSNYGGNTSAPSHTGSHTVHTSSLTENVNTTNLSRDKSSAGKGHMAEKKSTVHNTGGTPGGSPTVRNGAKTSNPAGNPEGGKTLQTAEKHSPASRPPLPRNTSGTDTATCGTMKSETLHKGGSSPAKGSEREVKKGGVPESNSTKPKMSHSNPSTNVTENKGGNTSSDNVKVSGADISYSYSDGGDSIRKSGPTSVMMGSGEKGSTLSSAEKTSVIKEGYTENHGELRDKESSVEHGTQERTYTQSPGRVQNSERRVNHEYKHGRFNPAAANRKTKQSYYQKDYTPSGREAEKEKRRKRREDNGKHKR